jgi:hypothetical protein
VTIAGWINGHSPAAKQHQRGGFTRVKSFVKNRSSVQSKATDIFSSCRSSLLRQIVRQSHQSKKPEKFDPRLLAIPRRVLA